MNATFYEFPPVTHPMPWLDTASPRAACADSHLFPDAWFPEKGNGTAQTVRAAKDICYGCPIRSECLQWALAENIREGVFGGLSRQQRDDLRRSVRAA